MSDYNASLQPDGWPVGVDEMDKAPLIEAVRNVLYQYGPCGVEEIYRIVQHTRIRQASLRQGKPA